MRALRITLITFLLLFGAGCSATTPATTPGLAAEASTPTSRPASPTAAPATAAPTPTTAPTVEPSPTPEPPTATAEPPSPTPQPTAEALPPLDPALAAQLQEVLDQTIADGYIPGAVLSVEIPGYQPWNGVSGFQDVPNAVPITAATLMRIASISKIFTAVVVLQLAEEGRIDLDAPIATWLPGLIPAGDYTTVRELLQHRSGLYDYLEDPAYSAQAYATPDRYFAPEELVRYAGQFPLAFQPGAPGAWDYSSTNYVILGMLVETVTGNSLAQETRARIFEPLGLERTFFTPHEELPEPLSRGHRLGEDVTAVAMSFAYATASLVSTPDDVRRFITALVAGELLQPESQAQMLTFVSGHGQYQMPELEYGLGIMRNALPVGPDAAGMARPASASRAIGHIGGFGGFRAAVWHVEESGITIALSVNQARTDPNTLATQALATILAYQGR